MGMVYLKLLREAREKGRGLWKRPVGENGMFI